MCDYSAVWPLWLGDPAASGAVLGEDESIFRVVSSPFADGPHTEQGPSRGDPDGLALTDGLVAALKAWQCHFDEHFHWQHGWDAETSEGWHTDEGRRLARSLEAEIGRYFRIELILTGA